MSICISLRVWVTCVVVAGGKETLARCPSGQWFRSSGGSRARQSLSRGQEARSPSVEPLFTRDRCTLQPISYNRNSATAPPQSYRSCVWFCCEVFGRMGPEHSDGQEHQPPNHGLSPRAPLRLPWVEGAAGHWRTQHLPGCLPAAGSGPQLPHCRPPTPPGCHALILSCSQPAGAPSLSLGSARARLLQPPGGWLFDIRDMDVGTTPGRWPCRAGLRVTCSQQLGWEGLPHLGPSASGVAGAPPASRHATLPGAPACPQREAL